MLMKTRLPIVLGVAALAFLPTESPACTRAVYLGPEGMTVTGVWNAEQARVEF